MDRRKEPRFQVYAPAKIAPLDEPELETSGQVIDISGSDLRLVADAEFQQGQTVTIETDQHLILAGVRNCLERGTRFGIGAEKLHSIAKLSLPQAASKAQRNQALVDDYRRSNPPLEIARPAEAVEITPASQPEAPILPAPSPKTRTAEPPVDLPQVASQAAWLSVPQGYPPVVFSASATLVLDPNGADLIPLRMGEPCPGEGPVPLPQADAIETPARKPQLLARQTDYRPPSEATALFARPPQSPACDPSWKGRQGYVPGLPPLDILRPLGDVARNVPATRRKNRGTLSRSPFLVEAPGNPEPPKEIFIAPTAHLPATVALQLATPAGKAPLASRAFVLAKAGKPLAIDSKDPLRFEPSSGVVSSTWLPVTVARQLPQVANDRPPSPIGLSLFVDAIPLAEHPSAAYPSANIETGPPVTRALPFLLSSSTLSVAAPAMPAWLSTQTLTSEAFSGWPSTLGVANLQPSHPSPMSLVTWSRSLAISIPARSRSNLGTFATVGLSANEGRAQALRPLSPIRRGYRLTPSLPLAGGASWTPLAPMQASLQVPAIKAIRPGCEGTDPPGLTPVRVQPASMPVIPAVSAPFGIEPGTGFIVLGLSTQNALTLTCMDVDHGTLRTAWELRAESSAILPSFLAARHAPVIGPEPSSYTDWWSATPPAQTIGLVEPFSALTRVARSVTARLPKASAVGLTRPHSRIPLVP